MAYTRLFYKVFIYLSHHNTKNITMVDNKEPLGLIHIYLGNIPFQDFTKKIMNELRTNRASSIRSFIEDTFLPKIRTILNELHHHRKSRPYFSFSGSAARSETTRTAPAPAKAAPRTSSPMFRRRSPAASLNAV